MAKALGGAETLSETRPQVYSLRSVLVLRLAVASLILLGSAIMLIGTSWDIQWHSLIGRDRTLIPPHIMMLSGIALSGLAALLVVIIESVWVRRNANLGRYSLGFAGLFHGTLGAYIAGFAALNAAIAFPLDSYWHALYGIDVAIWAPFHVMILGAAAIMPLGAAYMLVSTARLAVSTGGKKQMVRMAYSGALAALSVTLGIFTLLLADAIGEMGIFSFGAITINVFPILSGLLIAWILVASVYAIPWRGVATYIVLIYLFFGLLFQLFVPPATSYLLTQEHLQYRGHGSEIANLSLVAVQAWFLAPLLVALLIDFCFLRAKRKDWSRNRTFITLALVSVIAGVPISVLQPTLGLELAVGLGIGFALSMLLGLLGTLAGTWFGRRMGESMQKGKRV